jgi:hypothetical protein
MTNNVPVFVENLPDAELAIDRIARQFGSDQNYLETRNA